MGQIFHDPNLRRWKRLRRVTDIALAVATIVGIVFIFTVIRREPLPDLLLPVQKPNYRALIEHQIGDKLRKNLERSLHRRSLRRLPSNVQMNEGEGLRAAFYVNDEPSYSSLKQHIGQIDMLFPDWLHVVSATGTLVGSTPRYPVRLYNVVDKAGVQGVDPENRVSRLIGAAGGSMEVFPMLNDYNPLTQTWEGGAIGGMLESPIAPQWLHVQLDRFLSANPGYHGICLDFEQIPAKDQRLYAEWIEEIHHDFQARGLRLYVNVAAGSDDWYLKALGANADGVILMDYDEHEVSSGPGPVAGQSWFDANLQRMVRTIPLQKIICGVGNYGYDWSLPLPKRGERPSERTMNVTDLSVQEAWQRAAESSADVHLQGDELNPHFAYDDDDAHVQHQVWFLDGVTALNEMRDAQLMGIRTFALWRLGIEDGSLWSVWDHPMERDAPEKLETVPPGNDVDTEGQGDILRVVALPQTGSRTVRMDSGNSTIIDEGMTALPRSYVVEQYGYNPHELALTFDDGPDPTWTPKILDVLRKYHVKATFMVIGEEAQKYPGLLKEDFRDGNEIASHTFTHPDISEISDFQVQSELNLTERLFAAELGVRPLFFRPPYSIDQEPDTNDQAAPAYRIQQMGYIIIGDKIDTNDWIDKPRKSPQEIVNSVLDQIRRMKTYPWMRGSIVLMHDGGGNRSATVDALPLLITTLRAKGYQWVLVSDLMGKNEAQVMPPLLPKMRWQARIDLVAFSFFWLVSRFVVDLFFLGNLLMCMRLILIGSLALIDRLRRRRIPPLEHASDVAVLIPAYNEEKVIVRTIRSVLNSDYPSLRVIVVDDGSTDDTYEVARAAYPIEIGSGKLTVVTKPNTGKAQSLNYGLQRIHEEIFIGIDADTVIAPDAISRLVRHFADPRVGAVAGNAKVGNRGNLWTQWQALEYVTSQNFERRALNLFNVVTVVPGAIGAWRTTAVRLAGKYPVNTVAEDADLTMSLIQQGCKVIYEDRALAFTEAPANMRGLMQQRFRWSFGTLQAVFKHRHAFRTNLAMGLFAMPNIIVFQIALPLVSPLIDLMFAAGVIHYLLDKHFHPATASDASFDKLLAYFLAFLLIDFVTSVLAFSLERGNPANKGDSWLLFHIWLQRFAYRQVFSVVLLKTVKRAIDGRPFNWEKIERTAKLSRRTESITG